MKNSSVPESEKTDPEWTILNLLNWTASYFSSHRIEQPRATAEVLLAHTLGLKRIDLYLRYDQPLQRDELSRFKAFIKRRINDEPVAYITGEKEFWSVTLSVNPAVLIPRPETECLVEAALKRISKASAVPCCRVLDLGTGSGAIALALAVERPHARFFAMDRSPAAIRTARLNAERHDLAARIHFFVGDWLAALQPGTVFDLIVSNPPYIKQDDIKSLQPEIARYEPRGALDGGAGGLDALTQIIRLAKLHLTADGALLVEIGYDQKPPLEEIIRSIGGYNPPIFLKDYAGHDRILVLTPNPAHP